MSDRLMGRVLEQATSRGIPRLVLLAIAHHARDEATECWPSLSRLETLTGLTRRTVREAIKACEQAGDLTVRRDLDASRRRHEPNRYLVHPGRARRARDLDARGGAHLDLGDGLGEQTHELGEIAHEARGGAHPELGMNGKEQEEENARADAPEAPRATPDPMDVAENYRLATDPAVDPKIRAIARKQYLRLGGLAYGLELREEEAAG